MAKKITLAKLAKEESFANAGTVRSLPAEIISDLELTPKEFITDNALNQIQLPGGRIVPGTIRELETDDGTIPKRVPLSPRLVQYWEENHDLPPKMVVQVLRATTEYVANGKTYPKDRMIGLVAEMQ